MRRLLSTLLVGAVAFVAGGVVGRYVFDDPSPGTKPTESPRRTAQGTMGIPTREAIVFVAPEDLLGWWDGIAWREWQMGARVPVKGGESYRVMGPDGHTSVEVGSQLKEGCEINEEPGIDVGPYSAAARGESYKPLEGIAVSGTHELQPRRVEIMRSIPDVYSQAATEILTDLGIRDQQPHVAQVVRSDLDGDGRAEAIVVAERIEDSKGLFARKGDYSVLFLRRFVNGTVRNFPVRKSVQSTNSGSFVEQFRAAAVADLNGDDKMELVVHSRYYEGAGTSAYELRDEGSLDEVLSVGCGA